MARYTFVMIFRGRWRANRLLRFTGSHTFILVLTTEPDTGTMNTDSNLIAEGSTIRGGMSALRSSMKRAGFSQVGGIYSPVFTDGRCTFRGVIGTRCDYLGRSADLHTLRQVWG